MKRFIAALGLLTLFPVLGTAVAGVERLEHGRYIFFAAGCGSCHTVDLPLAGGRAINTPFGTFYTPNITPHGEYGIGDWSGEDFVRALREGVSPEGEHYYPAFPYASYTQMTRDDMLALHAYLLSQPTFSKRNRPHELAWFVRNRALIAHWKHSALKPGPTGFDPSRSEEWNRGQYIALAMGHCSECHTPRGVMGVPLTRQYLAGTRDGPEGLQVPNITPDRSTGIGDWSHEDMLTFLSTGRKPDGCYSTGLMMEVLGTSCMRLNQYDQYSLSVYLRSLSPIHNVLDATDDPFQGPDFYE